MYGLNTIQRINAQAVDSYPESNDDADRLAVDILVEIGVAFNTRLSGFQFREVLAYLFRSGKLQVIEREEL